MQLCAISSCENSINCSDDISLHSFPLGNTILLKRWVYNMKLSEKNPPLSYFICDKHFLPTCFEEGALKQDSIPTLAPVVSDSEETAVQTDQVDRKKSVVEENIGAFLCRMCSCSLDDRNMISIFDDKKKIFEKINSCLPIIVEDCNDLPLHICDKCCKQVERMYIIRSLSITAESLFFHHLSTFTVKEDHNNDDDKLEAETEKDKFWVTEDQLPLKGPVTCNLCDEEFTDMDKFDSHMEQHEIEFCEDPPSDMLNIVCSTCGLIFELEADYLEHKRKQKYECGSCDIILHSYCEMKKHECLLFENSDLFRVVELTNETNESNLENDQKLYFESNKKKNYHCSPCNRQFQRQVNWLKHKMKHEKDEFYECKECGQQFDKLRLLTQHKEKVHKNNQTWICRYCGKHTTTKLSLNIHERIHTGIKPFICEWCGNAFRSKANLSQHHAKHTGIRRHSCSVCGKKFSRKSFVTTHMRVHTGERPFACDICEQRFTQVGDMRRHRRRHIIQQQQQQQQSQNSIQNIIIQQVLLKEEKNDTDTDFVENSVIGTIAGNAIQIGTKISIADLRAHFL